MAIVLSKTRDEWEAIMAGSDVCFAPVLEPTEAPDHPQAQARAAFVEVAGVVQPAPVPRFERTPSAVQGPPAHPGQHSTELLQELGYEEEAARALRASGAVA